MLRFLLIILISLPTLALAQDSPLGNWIIYFGNKKLGSGWNWHHEVQYRNYNVAGDLEQLLLRTGIGTNLTEGNNNLLVGYGFIRSENYVAGQTEKAIVNEHRIYQQFITKQKAGRVGIQHRYRFEQRFIEDIFRIRFRYFLSLNVPLNQANMAAKTFYLSLYNEIFLNGDQTIFDRNRVYEGLGYKLNDTFRFELGYMNQLFTEGRRDQVNVIVFASF